MARIRSVKPELRTSLTVAAWPREVRYAWILLWGYLDDHGRGKDDMRLLLADLFPLDKDVTSRKLDRWLELMCQPGPDDPTPALCRYIVAGQAYLHAPKWGDHQKVSHPKASRIPSCPINHESPEAFVKPSGSPPEELANASVPRVRADQGRERKGRDIGRASGEAPPDDTIDPALIEIVTAATVVGEWVGAFTSVAGRQQPQGSMRAQAGREAKKLLEGGAEPRLVLEAARRAGGKGYATLEREYAPLLRPTNGRPNQPQLSKFVEQ